VSNLASVLNLTFVSPMLRIKLALVELKKDYRVLLVLNLDRQGTWMAHLPVKRYRTLNSSI
jgi:hypothetical protein